MEQIPLSEYTDIDKSHGRKVIRSIQVFDATEKYQTKGWTNLKAYIVVKRQRTIKGKTSYETAHFMSDIILLAVAFHMGIRGHWGIENKLHWVKDVVHNEDKNRIYCGNGAISAAIFSTIALNVHRKKGNKSVTHGQIKFGANVKELFKIIRT